MADTKVTTNPVTVGDKTVTFIFTPTGYYLDMQTKCQGQGGKMLIRKYAEEVLKRTEENYKVNDFTPNEITEVIEAFDTFCNAKGV